MCFTCDSVIRGYYVYKDIWEASSGQIFPCLQGSGNAFDPFTISIMRHSDIIGHVPIGCLFIFLQNSSSIKCTVTGNSQFSRDLHKVGLSY